jgi:hypothetical protein
VKAEPAPGEVPEVEKEASWLADMSVWRCVWRS